MDEDELSLLETLDHTHFYDDVDDALTAIGRDS